MTVAGGPGSGYPVMNRASQEVRGDSSRQAGGRGPATAAHHRAVAVGAGRAGDGSCPDAAAARRDRAGPGVPRAQGPGRQDGAGVAPHAGPVDRGPPRGRVRGAGPLAAAVPAPAGDRDRGAGGGPEDGEPGPHRRAGPPDPGRPGRVRAVGADDPAVAGGPRADHPPRRGAAGGVRPVRGRHGERDLDRGPDERPEGRRAAVVPGGHHRRPVPVPDRRPVRPPPGRGPVRRRAARCDRRARRPPHPVYGQRLVFCRFVPGQGVRGAGHQPDPQRPRAPDGEG